MCCHPSCTAKGLARQEVPIHAIEDLLHPLCSWSLPGTGLDFPCHSASERAGWTKMIGDYGHIRCFFRFSIIVAHKVLQSMRCTCQKWRQWAGESINVFHCSWFCLDVPTLVSTCLCSRLWLWLVLVYPDSRTAKYHSLLICRCFQSQRDVFGIGASEGKRGTLFEVWNHVYCTVTGNSSEKARFS